MKLTAISLHQPWASMITDGRKTIETRFWPTKFRGDLLICSTKKPNSLELPCGYALCIVELYDCRLYQAKDWLCSGYGRLVTPTGTVGRESYSWLLRNIRPLTKPFPVTGKQGFFHVEIPSTVTFLKNTP